MAKTSTTKVAFISSYLPRKCGIATFTSDLIKNASLASEDRFEPLVVAMRQNDNLSYAQPVKFEIRQNVKSDYVAAANYINFSHVDVVNVQHEYGIFGGEAGSYLSLLLNRLNAPVITTLHTLLAEPDEAYKQSLVDVCDASHQVITMNERGVDMLREIYGIRGKKVRLIAHGIPDLPFVDSNYYKHKFGMEGRRTILTFGLLSKNKGIETMLEALPKIIEVEPNVLYVVLGMTHPSVLKHDGESYRFSLQRMVKELGLEKHVIFHNRFVHDEELSNFLCATDIYVTPYLNAEQLTSGTLSFAVGTGKAVVSTPYWAALELLADGRGEIIPFRDSEAIAKAIIGILQDDTLFYSLRRRAYEYGRSRTWHEIGVEYWKLFSSKQLPVFVRGRTAPLVSEVTKSIEVPEPSLVHLKRLTDDTGIMQHARFTVPNRNYGYCTDDNSRAVIVMTKYYSQYPDAEALKLFDTYLSFVMHSQDKNGTVKNLMNYDRTWLPHEALHDALGRTLWAYGTIMAEAPSPSYLSIIKDRFDRSVEYVSKQFPRGMAYSILGMSDYLKQFPGASDIKRYLETAANQLVAQYETNKDTDWQWFEDTVTYDNAVLPQALFVAGLALGKDKYLSIGKETCEFLLRTTFTGEHFSFVGCKGWYPHNETKAQFDQQPIEAMSTVLMLRSAYDATKEVRYLSLQRKAFDWFLGANDLRTALYDFKNKGCHDGLTASGVNLNQGAESTLSFLLGLLAIIESYHLVDKITEISSEVDKNRNINQTARRIESIPPQKGKTTQIEEKA